MNRFDNIDCMIGMEEYPDKHFDLAIVDPPFFKGVTDKHYFGRGNSNQIQKPSPWWDKGIPKKKYYEELVRVSKHQIIWGINYFDSFIKFVGPGRIIWDKLNDQSNFADAEIASCSLFLKVKIIRHEWNGFLRCETIEKIHPTQKPIKLYKRLLIDYAKPGDKILDTHVGSASSLIACEDMGFEYVGFELDKDYYEAAQKRLTQFRSQLKLAI